MVQENLLEKRIRGWMYEAAQDVVGLWELCRAAREDWGAKTPQEVRERVLSLVRALLRNGVQAVEVLDQRPWPTQDPDEVVERISREWDTLGREPNVPDIVWFKRS